MTSSAKHVLPALKVAEREKIVRPDRAALRCYGKHVALSGGRPTVERGILKFGEKEEARWKVNASIKEDLDLSCRRPFRARRCP